MWEEHPAYQKAQAKMIGIGVVLLFICGVVYAVSTRDRELLRTVCLIAGALIFALTLLSGTAWLLVRLFTRPDKTHSSGKQITHKSKSLLLVLTLSFAGTWAIVYHFTRQI